MEGSIIHGKNKIQVYSGTGKLLISLEIWDDCWNLYVAETIFPSDITREEFIQALTEIVKMLKAI